MTDKILTLDEWTQEFSEPVVAEVLLVLETEEDRMDCRGELVRAFLASFVGAVIYRALISATDEVTDKRQRLSVAMNEYALVKENIQDAVAAGFSGAMSTLSKKEVEYYCQVKPLPEAANEGGYES